jgi:acetyltransferase-like isoleucine patch superfamily enzyme
MCIINTGAVIEHDCSVGDFSHISVRSVLCGNVNVGKAAFVGANATVIQGKSIGDNCIIGAGTTIRKNVESNHMAAAKDTIISV